MSCMAKSSLPLGMTMEFARDMKLFWIMRLAMCFRSDREEKHPGIHASSCLNAPTLVIQ